MRKRSVIILLTLISLILGTSVSNAEAALEQGESGETVIEVQEKLIDLGYLEGSADGIFGEQTKIAIEQFQKDNSIEVTGSLDEEDKAKLFSENVIFTQEFAIRAAVVAMTNSLATDVMTEDGSAYNPELFHRFSDTSGYHMSIYDEGKWQLQENSWHVDDLILEIEEYGTYLKGSMDVNFDGTNYIVTKVNRVVAQLENLDSEDANKVNKETLEVSDFNSFLTVSPDLIEEDRDLAGIEEELSEENISENKNYLNDASRDEWIDSQFSFWNGSHNALEDLIKENLNNEDSYDHIETTYIDVYDEERQILVNETLAGIGCSQQVEIGDLLIMVEFSAENAFGGTIKNMAYGIASYSTDTISLVTIL